MQRKRVSKTEDEYQPEQIIHRKSSSLCKPGHLNGQFVHYRTQRPKHVNVKRNHQAVLCLHKLTTTSISLSDSQAGTCLKSSSSAARQFSPGRATRWHRRRGTVTPTTPPFPR
eukprot:scpid40607/ scgid23585/ 